MKSTSVLSVLASALLLASCGADLSTPRNAVKSFMAAAEDDDEEGLRACLVATERDNPDITFNQKESSADYTVLGAAVDGARAVVPVQSGNDTINVVALREGTEWRISIMETVCETHGIDAAAMQARMREAMTEMSEEMTRRMTEEMNQAMQQGRPPR